MGKKLLIAAVAAVIGVVTAAGPASAATQPGYVALGDSYASGVGTRTYFDTSCDRSVYAYSELLASRLGLALNLQACSGAKTSDVLANQVAALSASTQYVTISVGGNDIGFSGVIEKCALPLYNCTGDITKAEALITSTLPGALDNVYTQIHTRAPNAKVVVVGYPRLFNGVECNVLARLSPTEQGQLNAGADQLDTAIKARAVAHGFTFLDPRSAFTGHAVCDSVEWLNGLSNPVSESYHPNRDGHVAFADLLQPLL
jgi:lysophospholipase L1-like esterase